ncbi:MAG: OmpW family protein [Acetobacter sp.]|nr:OmpW family protein [Acetobacter sp.]
MSKIRSLFTSFTAMVAGFATFADVAKAQTPNRAYVNAPVMSHIPDAPKAKGHCGVFETCANTEIGLGRGNFTVTLSAVYIMPQDRDDRLWANTKGVTLNGSTIPGSTMVPLGGSIHTSNAVMPELTLKYFLTDNLSIGLIATSTRHQVMLRDVTVPALGKSLGTINAGTAWVLPPSLTLAWHFRPHKRFNPYVGVGGSFAWFHDEHSNLTRSGIGLNAGFTGGPLVNAGFDYQLVGNWFFNLDIKQIFARMHAWAKDLNDVSVGGLPQGAVTRVTVHDSLDPTVVSAGITYRFF